ncbi:hypothetical protein DICSQDRAFT_181063 [Dichomitus squalens LYAD-421 SS1]|uniref:ATP synthase subunit 5, mitochondrial n=1 Tax=Dichomitus squalens (strain LYAD-421) TaxID=732165 RepID=R7SXA1_DICSQ|nr:uncharacterized protein DICSQDRAFT_181063 [Dichomitus squalens LYAD-421 SS1]EJF60799.1 hypothetical protein DICSQDRAFT_181063 [Dichomitus squalens LYAD-421 SS1]
MFAASARSAALSAGLGRRAASTIAQKYSSAVFSAALNKSPQVLSKVQTELNAIQSAVKSNAELSSFIHNPTLSTKDRSAGLPALYAAAGKEGVSDITKNLFIVLSENGRLVETEGVIEGFNELVANYRGELNVTITSAAPLPKDIQTRLETLLKQSQAAQQAKSLKITNKINPAVLGGVVVDFGEKTIDLSVASRVNKLNNLLSPSILRRYPFSTGLFREILQNSDDARATKQVFVLDRRQFGTKTLIKDGLSHLQGPAFLAYNDAVFSDADWEAIRTVSESSKTGDTEKIGKHGLGSRAYYHLTDNPQYLSGGYHVVFDPHRWAFGQGGWKQSLEEIARDYPDQLEPFSSLLPHGDRTSLPGTIVRLALRPATAASRISSKKVTADEIHDLLLDFVRKELDVALLFLSHLTCIEVREIGVDGAAKTLASVTASLRPPVPRLYSRTISTTIEASASTTREWSIIHASFEMEEGVELLCKSLEASKEWVEGEVVREKLRPNVALAFPTNASQGFRGRLFTYLPLPLVTGFPCHIHGVFSLTDSRQNLRNPSETIMRETADALAVAWNKLLFNTLIPRTWLEFLEGIAAGLSPTSLYDSLPPLQDQNTSGDAMYWTSLLRDLVKLADERVARIWPVFGLAGPPQAMRYASLQDVLVAGSGDDQTQLHALARAGVDIVVPPSELRRVLLDIRSAQELTPTSARPRLVASESLRSLSPHEKNRVVEFLLRSHDLRELIDVPVFTLISGVTAALQAYRRDQQVVHVLLDEAATEVFGQFGTNAISLRDVPPVACTLLVGSGRGALNVCPLDRDTVIAYIQSARSDFASSKTSTNSAWSWGETVGWLEKFWTWIQTSSLADGLQSDLRQLPLLPTIAGETRSVEDQVFSHSCEVADLVRNALSNLGVHVLDARIPSAYLERQKWIKSLSKASELLDVFFTVSLVIEDDHVAKILRAHLASCLRDDVSLTGTQQMTLRELPIHLVLTDNVSESMQPLPPNNSLHCVDKRHDIALPLPLIPDATFIHCTTDQRPLIEHLDYSAVTRPLTMDRLLQLHADHFSMQTPHVRIKVLRYLVERRSVPKPSIAEKLWSSPIVLVGQGNRFLPPKDVVDPQSEIADIVPPWDPDAICRDDSANSETTSLLAALNLLRRKLDVDFVVARISSIAHFDPSSEKGSDLAKRLLSVMDRTWFNWSDVSYDRELAWLPTTSGLRRPSDCRDQSHGMLCDRVLPILDMQQLQSVVLRRMLGWDAPVPLETLMEQFRMILAEPEHPSHPQYLIALTSEFGRRFGDMTSAQLDDVAAMARQARWVMTSGGVLKQPAFAVFKLSVALYGFGQIPIDIAERHGVEKFLTRMGCTQRPHNDAIIDQLRQLHQAQAQAQASGLSDGTALECVLLLQALDHGSLTSLQQERILAPDVHSRLRTVQGLYYNDLGSRAIRYDIPNDRIQAHNNMPHALCIALQIPSLGSLHLQPLDLGFEDMREDLTTRIGNVLRAYNIQQAFNEFLANASDAGARKFNIMLDCKEDRRADPSEVLCENMAQFCRGPALVVHNDAEFTMDDIRGICRVGRGGKEGKEDTVGRFGLGSLSFYHFSEVAMILSGSNILLLDPSGRFLPEDWRWNSYAVSLEKIKGLYPGHVRLFHDLFGYQGEDHYQGTIIRLPLRTDAQAVQSALSRRSLSTCDVSDMLERYQAVASRSLFFIGIEEITASVNQYGRRAPTEIWSVTAKRIEDIVSSGSANPRLLIDLSHSSQPLGCKTSSWLIATTVIAPESFPDWVQSVVDRHRLKQVSIALAAKISAVERNYLEQPSSEFHFCSSLPLPISTCLPMHVHASFVLADDRRNIRWDGDGMLYPEAKYNHWLLSCMLPPLYLQMFALFNERFGDKAPLPWPGNLERFTDPFSKTLVDAFFSDNLLRATPQRIFRSVTGRLIDPSTAVVRGGEPQAVKDVLDELCPEDLVKLPPYIRSRVLNLPFIRKTSPQYLCDLIATRTLHFLDAYRRHALTVAHVEAVIRYLLAESPMPTSSLVGLPLLPLADGSLSSIRAEGAHEDRVYTLPRGERPWPLFPATRFLDPELDKDLILKKSWNVALWDKSAVAALLRSTIPEAPRLEASESEWYWIVAFWRFFQSVSKKLLTALKSFPLIPTEDDRILVSLNSAIAFPAILPPAALDDDATLVLASLRKLGVVVVKTVFAQATSQLPRRVRDEMESAVRFSFQRMIQILHHLNEDGRLQNKFGRLSDDEQTRVAFWLRGGLRDIPSVRANSPKPQFLDVVRHLPIWPTSRGGRPSGLRPLSATSLRVLPSSVKPVDDITRFLLTDTSFVECSHDIVRLQLAQPMSSGELLQQLKFPSFFRNSDTLGPYKTLLNILVQLGDKEVSGRLQVPNENLEMLNIHAMYKSDVSEFTAAFTYRANEVFIHSDLRSYEAQLTSLGLRHALSFENFKACVLAIDKDFKREDLRDQQKAQSVYGWYSTRLPLSVANDNDWRGLDSYAFIPRHHSRRLGSPTASEVAQFAVSLPLIVSPKKILRHQYSPIAWTQRALFPETPNKKLFLADEAVGVPTVEEVVEHLHVLATKIAPRYPGDSGLLDDLKATYGYLNEHHEDSQRFMVRCRKEALFLNVDNPESDSWTFLPACQIMLNVSDEDGFWEVRDFLRPFRDLLVVSGAFEIKIPKAAPPPTTSAEGLLIRLRASLDEQRRNKLLTDVIFRITGEGEAGHEGDLWAHRALLVSASDYFNRLFCGQSGFSESRAASVEDPVVMSMEDELELHCTGLVLDYIYTGQFEETQDRECLLEMMTLSHRWELKDVQAHAEALLVPTITPGTYHELRQRAEAIEAKYLLEKIDEFERDNAYVLGDMA